MRGPAKNIKCINKLTRVVPVTTPIHCFKHMLCPSHFRNTLPGDPVANAEGAMATVIAQLKVLPVTVVARKITGQPSAGPGGTVHHGHPPGRDHKRGRGGPVTSTRRMEEEAATGLATWRPLLKGHSSQRHTSSSPSRSRLLSHSHQHHHSLPKW